MNTYPYQTLQIFCLLILMRAKWHLSHSFFYDIKNSCYKVHSEIENTKMEKEY